MTDEQITRRRFMWDSLAGAAGITVGLSAAERTAGKTPPVEAKKSLNYNLDMDIGGSGRPAFWFQPSLWVDTGNALTKFSVPQARLSTGIAMTSWAAAWTCASIISTPAAGTKWKPIARPWPENFSREWESDAVLVSPSQ